MCPLRLVTMSSCISALVMKQRALVLLQIDCDCHAIENSPSRVNMIPFLSIE